MRIAGRHSRELSHVRVLDPVAAGASALRTKVCRELQELVGFDAIRGNVSELKALALGSSTTRGVDASAADAVTDANLDEMASFVKNYARETGSIIAITGAIDLVAAAGTCYVIRNGRAEMGRVTGTGCMLSGVLCAYLIANPTHKLEAAVAAVCLMGLAGEVGWSLMQEGDGNATYRDRIIDALYNIDGAQLDEGARYERR
jgi:hydroxyethylthiazole kinase